VIATVQFFVEDRPPGADTTPPHEMPLDSLPARLHTLSATTTTNFGDQAVAPARQAGVNSSTRLLD